MSNPRYRWTIYCPDNFKNMDYMAQLIQEHMRFRGIEVQDIAQCELIILSAPNAPQWRPEWELGTPEQQACLPMVSQVTVLTPPKGNEDKQATYIELSDYYSDFLIQEKARNADRDDIFFFKPDRLSDEDKDLSLMEQGFGLDDTFPQFPYLLSDWAREFRKPYVYGAEPSPAPLGGLTLSYRHSWVFDSYIRHLQLVSVSRPDAQWWEVYHATGSLFLNSLKVAGYAQRGADEEKVIRQVVQDILMSDDLNQMPVSEDFKASFSVFGSSEHEVEQARTILMQRMELSYWEHFRPFFLEDKDYTRSEAQKQTGLLALEKVEQYIADLPRVNSVQEAQAVQTQLAHELLRLYPKEERCATEQVDFVALQVMVDRLMNEVASIYNPKLTLLYLEAAITHPDVSTFAFFNGENGSGVSDMEAYLIQEAGEFAVQVLGHLKLHSVAQGKDQKLLIRFTPAIH